MQAAQQETIYTMAMARLGFHHLAGVSEAYRRAGSATTLWEHRGDIRAVLPEASPRLAELFQHLEGQLSFAEKEYARDEANGIQVLCYGDDAYPQRLKECPDAPLTLFYKGTADLNARRVVCVVGTRRCTAYGQDLVRKFVKELRRLCPDTLIVSGLAYGVDINAHRQALQNGFETVGVLAHGLDSLYPRVHLDTARAMMAKGGLLTEYPMETKADKLNFVRRNRIVAGLSDACILVESAAHGGGLITAGIARDYHRDVFAFPGAVGAPYSEGCNRLIAQNNAALMTGADDFAEAMGWVSDRRLADARKEGIERELFPALSQEEALVVDKLKACNDLHVNVLVAQTGLPVHRLTALLFNLEMKGLISARAGGSYHLLG